VLNTDDNATNIGQFVVIDVDPILRAPDPTLIKLTLLSSYEQIVLVERKLRELHLLWLK
jgi:hypothetical protein